MRVTGPWLDDPAVQSVLRCLTDAGHRALIVGGAVRNALMGLPVAEVDLATSADPETVTKLAESAGFRVVPTGLAHGTVTVVVDGKGFEITSFRRDAETFGRHARVAFDAGLEQDAARRDLTMNALYADAAGVVIDPLGGLGDVLARRVRFVGDPALRIAEDYLRILRFFRFQAQYGADDLNADALAACAAFSAGLETLSAERIGAEMRKLLTAPDPAPAVAAMQSSGVLQRILPGADARALPVLVHLEPAPGPWLTRLAALGDLPTHRLRLTRTETRDLASLRRAINWTAHEAGYRLGAQLGTQAALLRAALMETPPDLTAVAQGAAARFPLRASDLPDLTGAALGHALKRAEDHWIARNLAPLREELIAIARKTGD
jgi:poly(A) polymerase